MKSIQTKFVALILVCTCISCVATGGAGIWSAQNVVQADSVQIMNLLCEEKVQEMDAVLAGIEQAVWFLAELAQMELDLDYADELGRVRALSGFMECLPETARRVMEKTEAAMTVYIRLPAGTPDFKQPLLLGNIDGSGYRTIRSDEYSGWESVCENCPEQAEWMSPCYQEDIGSWTAAYVAPLYRDGEVAGLVGIDIDSEAVNQSMASVGIYESGFAFLTDSEGNIIYHPGYSFGTAMEDADESLEPVVKELRKGSSEQSLFYYRRDGQQRALAFRTLRNGAQLSITAPMREINEGRDRLLCQNILALVCTSALAILLAVKVSHRVVRPLRELDKAAKKIAIGDFTTDIKPTTKDEVGTLAQSIGDMSNQLRRYVGDLNTLAYRDTMTGVRNKTAYLEAAHKMQERIETEKPQFALVVLDINFLKLTNDTYGHVYGDKLIVSGCQIICRVFDHSPVYRFGGDEFVVILENRDFEDRQKLTRQFIEKIKGYNKTADARLQLSISWGMAVYDPQRDASFSDVFKRADDAMYEHKKVLTQGGRNKRG